MPESVHFALNYEHAILRTKETSAPSAIKHTLLIRPWCYLKCGVLLALLVGFMIIIPFVACNESDPHPSLSAESTKLVVAVVGEGVRYPGESQTHTYATNIEQAQAMWSGAFAALEKSSHAAQLKNVIELLPYDDEGRAEKAVQVAREISRDPRVVAVIGHGSSGTTRAAAPIYAAAGIPLLMPIATSPSVALPTGDAILGQPPRRTAVRLPPSDALVQVPALAMVVRNSLNGDRCYLVCDTTPDAEEYSRCFRNEVPRLIGDIIRDTRDFNRRQDSVEAIASAIHSLDTDLVIICGYSRTANALMHAIRKEYGTGHLPKILMTDGCKNRDLDTSGLDAYVLFPAPDLASPTITNRGNDIKNLRELIRSNAQSYQMYGYDSILLLAQVFRRSDRQLSRSSLIRAFAEPTEYQGSFFSYSFRDGENRNASYYLFRASMTRKFRSTESQPVTTQTRNDVTFSLHSVVNADLTVHKVEPE